MIKKIRALEVRLNRELHLARRKRRYPDSAIPR